MRQIAVGTGDRTVVLCGATDDPGPEETFARGITLLAHETSAGNTFDGSQPFGVVGWSAGGLDACALAARYPDRVDRMVLLATPHPTDEAELAFDPAQITAKTLLLYGAKDPLTGSRHATWWKKRLSSARVEMHPTAGHDLLVPMWGRVLSHLAPRRRN